jgi:hypothetical protein
MARCTSTAKSTAPMMLSNSASRLSPAVLISVAAWRAKAGSMRSRRNCCRREKVPASSEAISRM